jgi:hypothetical protein
MRQRNILLVSILLILLVYSSEVSFMPNFKDKPDKWELIFPMLTFYSWIIIQLIWNLYSMFRNKKMEWVYTIFSLNTLFCFTLLNNPKGNSQELGYLGLMVIFLFISIMKFYKAKN